MNRSYTRARNGRLGRLKGEQIDFAWPRRGRPSKHRVLERGGQLQLELTAARALKQDVSAIEKPTAQTTVETFDAALQMTFPVRPMTEDELAAEFNRLFPPQ